MIVLRGPTQKGPADLERKFFACASLLIRTDGFIDPRFTRSNFRAASRITRLTATF
jgi:hypothetical protein